MSPVLLVRQLGLLRYSAGLLAQRQALDAHLAAAAGLAAAPNQLLLLEHQPVYTVGLRAGRYGPEEQERLQTLGAEFVRTDRGGLITFHGPGQLVLYPMLNLTSLGINGPRRYVCALEKSVIEACRRMGVTAGLSPHTGVWVGDNKICAIGVHFTRRVLTSHGLALNCCTDLSWFRHIVPWGIEGKFVTSLSAELGRHVTTAEAAGHLVASLAETLRCDVIWESEGGAELSDSFPVSPEAERTRSETVGT